MGIKSGRFTGRNGHEYEVALVGARVATDTIELGIPPATISMAAGEHKFNGFKSTTATVNILTDAPLIELYSAGVTDIRLTIEDMTDDKVEFDGYVTPFAFDQPYTGKNDSVTVNAVDLLTARKEVKYENITTDNEREYGTDRYAIDIIASLAHNAGIETIVEHINFDVTTTSPLHVKVAQAGFLQDEVGELDALSGICKFFGMTACCVGRTLYLYDEHCLLNANQGHRINANVYDITDGRAVRTAQYYDSQDTPLNDQVLMSTDAVHNDISVTIERAYDGIQITPEGSDTSVLLPDVCADENLTWLPEDDNSLGGYTRKASYTDGTVVYRRPMASKLLRCGKGGSSSPTEWPENVENYGDYLRPDSLINGGAKSWNTGAIPIRYINAKAEEAANSGYTAYVPLVSSEKSNLIWLRFVDGNQYAFTQKKCYSHTSGYIRLTASLILTGIEDYVRIEHVNNGTWLEWMQLGVGGVYLRYDDDLSYPDEGWGAKSVFTSIQPTDDGSAIASSYRAADLLVSGKIVKVPNNGPVHVDGYSVGTAGLYNYFLKSLSVEAVGDDINLSHPDMKHVYGSGDELLKVSTMLTSRSSGVTDDVSIRGSLPYGVNARPSVVPETSWNGDYMGNSNTQRIPISGILMEQLKARYAQPRICYKMTVEKNINPYAAVYFGGKGYTVEAYDKDLYNSTTTITID